MKAVICGALFVMALLGGCSGSHFPDGTPPVVEDLVQSPDPAVLNGEVMIEVNVVERESPVRVVVSIDANADGVFEPDEVTNLTSDPAARVTLGTPVTWTAAGHWGVTVVAESNGGVTTANYTVEVGP